MKTPMIIALIIFSSIVILLLLLIFGFFTKADRAVLFGSTESITFDDENRTYRLFDPNPEATDKKLVVGLHGLGGDGRRFAYYTALHNVTDEKTVLLYPDSIRGDTDHRSGWNAKYCCGSGLVNKTPDAEFLVYLIDKVVAENNIDPEKVFVTGFSNGAAMSHLLATEYPDKFKAIAPVSGAIGVQSESLTPREKVPVLVAHGKKDASIPFNGGVTGDDDFFDWLPFSESVERWKVANKCKSDGAEAENSSNERLITEYEDCGLVEVVYPELEHKWDNWRIGQIWRQKPRGSQLVVDFFDSQLK